MRIHKWALGLGTVGLGLVLAFGPTSTENPAEAQPDAGAADAGQQEGVQAQGRGPVHEAFAEPGSARPLSPPLVAKKPPDPIEELPPDQKPEGDNMHWITGYWAYDDDRVDFTWVSGCWRAYPPGRLWMPGHWAEVSGGWQWTPGFWSAQTQQQTSLLPVPPETLEAGPSAPAPSAESVYAPGCWVYQTTRYVWRPGFWYMPRPGWCWTPARYVWTPAGCVFIDGYWDYALETRGCLFAPVVIERRFWGRPRWVYRPCCVIYRPALLCSLFVRPACGCYFFGDYFEPRYRRLGFVAWVDFRIGRTCCDPLFSFCRWQYRGDRAWERNLRTVYVDRYRGTYPRPPRTFVQQTTVVNNISVNKTTSIRNVTMMAPLSRVDRSVVKLQPVPRATWAREQKAALEQRAMARQRQQTAAGLAAHRGSGAVRMRLPQMSTAVRPAHTIQTPPHPQRPVRPVKPIQRPRPTPRSDPRRPLTNVEHKNRPVNSDRPGPVNRPSANPRPEPRKPLTNLEHKNRTGPRPAGPKGNSGKPNPAVGGRSGFSPSHGGKKPNKSTPSTKHSGSSKRTERK